MTQQPYYETMYILRPDIPEEEVESPRDQIPRHLD